MEWLVLTENNVIKTEQICADDAGSTPMLTLRIAPARMTVGVSEKRK